MFLQVLHMCVCLCLCQIYHLYSLAAHSTLIGIFEFLLFIHPRVSKKGPNSELLLLPRKPSVWFSVIFWEKLLSTAESISSRLTVPKENAYKHKIKLFFSQWETTRPWFSYENTMFLLCAVSNINHSIVHQTWRMHSIQKRFVHAFIFILLSHHGID